MNQAAPNVRVIGRYALHGPIASGGMATVHFGRLLGAAGFSRTVAIKRLHRQFSADPDFVSMFVDEARVAARVRHPNVVPTIDVVSTEDELFLVMEYVAGESLARLLRALRADGLRMQPSIIVAVLSGVLRGLHAAHEASDERGAPLGIVHRDVSPQNVLVGADGLARVFDFGVAKAAGRLQVTVEGQLKGKLAYMPPEQIRSEPLDRRADVYAASVCLWEMLAGQRLFRGEDPKAVVAAVLAGNIPLPTEVLARHGVTFDVDERRAREELEQVALTGLAYETTKRFATAQEMDDALVNAASAATSSRVGDWVEETALAALAERAGQVAEIEGKNTMIESAAVSCVAARSEEDSAETTPDRRSPPPVPDLVVEARKTPALAVSAAKSPATNGSKPSLDHIDEEASSAGTGLELAVDVRTSSPPSSRSSLAPRTSSPSFPARASSPSLSPRYRAAPRAPAPAGPYVLALLGAGIVAAVAALNLVFGSTEGWPVVGPLYLAIPSVGRGVMATVAVVGGAFSIRHALREEPTVWGVVVAAVGALILALLLLLHLGDRAGVVPSGVPLAASLFPFSIFVGGLQRTWEAWRTDAEGKMAPALLAAVGLFVAIQLARGGAARAAEPGLPTPVEPSAAGP